jgi:hypothetical protein
MNLDCMSANIETWNIGNLNFTGFALGLILVAGLFLLRPNLFKKSPALVSGLVFGAFFLYYLVTYIFFENALLSTLMDGGIYDHAFFFLCFPVTYYYIAMAFTSRYRLFAIVMTLCLFFVEMEEIHWGQAIVFYVPPEWVLKAIYIVSWPNRDTFYDASRWCGLQMNFHNGLIYVFVFFLMFAYFGILPLLARKKHIRAFFDNHGIIIPRGVICAGIVLNFILSNVFLGIKLQYFEHSEIVGLVALLFIAWEHYPSQPHNNNNGPAPKSDMEMKL